MRFIWMEAMKMKTKRKSSLLLKVVLVLGVLFSSWMLRNNILNNHNQEAHEEADFTLQCFYRAFTDRLEQLDYAETLANTAQQASDPQTFFTQHANTLLATHEELVAAMYFVQDTLVEITPKEPFAAFLGKDLQSFPYSYTLAKVTKHPVIKGPEPFLDSDQMVFLFAFPIVENDSYLGEVLVAIDETYIMEQVQLANLQEKGYEYELWGVNDLGAFKQILATSNDDLDYSDAVKRSFSYPANWHLSIMPEEGWLPLPLKLSVDFFCLGIGGCFLALLFLLKAHHQSSVEKQRAKDIEFETQLLHQEAFCRYLDQRIQKKKRSKIILVHLHLHHLQEVCEAASLQEIQDYYASMREKLQECFPEGYLAARCGKEVFAIAIFVNEQDQGCVENIEEVSLHLIWKKRIQGKKIFVEPAVQLVRYPQDGRCAMELLEKAQGKATES